MSFRGVLPTKYYHYMYRTVHNVVSKNGDFVGGRILSKTLSTRKTNLSTFRHDMNYPSRTLMTKSSIFQSGSVTTAPSPQVAVATRILPQQQQQQRSIHFLPFLGIWGLKHISTWTLYNACKSYGWPRVYKRLLEQNRILHHQQNQKSKLVIQRLIRQAIQAPPQFVAQLSESYTQYIVPLLQRIATSSSTEGGSTTTAGAKVPQFLIVTAKYILNSQKPIKIIQDFVNAAANKK